jgi:hypothetical protein
MDYLETGLCKQDLLLCHAITTEKKAPLEKGERRERVRKNY